MTTTFPKLFITDLDGTALGGGYRPYSKLPAAYSAFLNQLAERGCMWATCTTWEENTQVNLIHASLDAPLPAYLIVGSGLKIVKYHNDGLVTPVEPYSGNMALLQAEVVHRELNPLIQEVCSQFNAKQMAFNGYWFSMTVQDSDVNQMMEFTAILAARFPTLKIMRIAEEMRFYVHPLFLRKGTPVKELQRLLGLKPEHIVVAGDEMMDLDMMGSDSSAHVLCPSNAQAEVKHYVHQRNGFVGSSPCSDGIIDAFHQLASARGWNFN